MTKNEGTIDRVVRIVIAAVAFAIAAAVGFSTAGDIVLAVVGIVMLVTAAVGFCPIYKVFGFNTCPRRVQSGA